MIAEWSQDEINEVVNKHSFAAVYFYTPLCGTCRVAGKMLEIVAQILPELKLGKADLNYYPSLSRKYEVESVPCLLLIKEGQVLEKIYAFHSVPYLLEKLNIPMEENR